MRKFQAEFDKFHSDNPTVISELVTLADQLMERGHTQYSIKGLFEVLRHRRALKTVDAHSDFKLNNNYTAHYARLIMAEYPRLDGFFKIRSSQDQTEFLLIHPQDNNAE